MSQSEKRFRLAPGMSLIEVMIAMAVMAFLTAGFAGLINHVIQMQSNTNMVSTLKQLQGQLKTNIENGDAWAQTVNDPANVSMVCLRAGNPAVCNHNSTADFKLNDLAGGTIFDGLTPGNGFTSYGSPCTGWNVAGNSTCPISYKLEWTAFCPSAQPTCKNPTVQINAALLFAPEPSSTFRVNTLNYSLSYTRGGNAGRNEPLKLRYVRVGNSGGGACPTGTWVPRPLNDEVFDVGNNASLVNPTRFQLQTGTYECQIISSSFDVRGFGVRLYDITNSIAYQAGISNANKSSSTAVGNVTFSLTSATIFEVQQQCEVNNNSFDLGMPVPDYNESVFTEVYCTRTS